MYNYLFCGIATLTIINCARSECICTKNKEQARCIHMNMEAINARSNQGSERLTTINTGPQQILPTNALQFGNIQRIKLVCNIQALKTSSFGNQDNLKELDLGENSISTIPNDLFAPMPLLEKLNLSHNTLHNPTLDTFYALNNLKILDFSHNDIAGLQLGVLDEMSKLEKMYLSNNKIPIIELGVFDELKYLMILDLSYNHLHQIVLGLFDQNKELVEVNLGGNYFTGEVPLGTFDSFTKVTALNLADCKINKLPQGIFDAATNIVKLDLSKNNIQELPNGIFDNVKNLELLSISNCKLTNLPAHLFDQNSKLASLNLSGNKFGTLPNELFRPNEELTHLNLSHNIITQLPIKIFQYTNLSEIDISYNKFATIEPDLLNMETLEKVHAQDNQINYLDETTFATNNFPLKYLDLRNNKLVFIGEYFFDWVANLERIEIFGNPWDCKCLEDLLSILNKKFIEYATDDYYQGKLPICVYEGLNVCDIDRKKLDYYYNAYKKGL